MISYLFSCEYATCAVPEAHRELFLDAEDVLQSADGWNPGSLNLGQGFAMKFRTPLVHGDVTRLLIDLERDGDERWSRLSLPLPETTRAKLADRHEKPYRALLVQRVAEDLRRKAAVIHILVHTTAAIDGRVTFETPQSSELAETVAADWRNRLGRENIDALLHRNSGGSALTADLDRRIASGAYGQIRLTVSQSFFLEGRPLKWEALKKLLMETLAQSVAETAAAIAPPEDDMPATGDH